MKMVIYYFSGTGNSLAVAKRLADNLGEGVELRSIAGYENDPNVKVDEDLLGLIFPVQFVNAPQIVQNFLRKMEFKTDPYIFAMATCNAVPGFSLFTIKRMLEQKGKQLALGFAIDMPGNAIVGKIDLTSPPEEQKRRLTNAEVKLSSVIQMIKERRRGLIEGHNSLKLHIESFLMSTYIQYLYRPEKRFRAQKNCSHCGTCIRVCPVNNISMDAKDNPIWGKYCVHCLACFHWCPKQAINLEDHTIGKRRYHHPEISIEDITAL
jgi:ferredoxin